MSFKGVFIAAIIAGALIFISVLSHVKRDLNELTEPSAEMVKASGKCAECHRHETGAIVHQFEKSEHAKLGVNCLDCHRVGPNQEAREHNGFTINTKVTAGNCKQCHSEQYEQFNRSRHGAPSWAAVEGRDAFTPEQIAHAEKYNKGSVDRPANGLASLEGEDAKTSGCKVCHSIGKPEADGTIGDCTKCHSRHDANVKLARTPETCGQCHMGPDHSQLEIYNESKHGAMFYAHKDEFNLEKDPEELTTVDMSVPTCATCHMSGIDGSKFTHDVTERLSYNLFAEVTEKRANYALGQANMKDICGKCHSASHTEAFYKQAEAIVESTNKKVTHAKKIMEDLRAEGYLTPAPFDEAIEFVYFDLWHYFGRTAKHGAFMGGPDFVQWHGNYELLLKTNELEELAHQARQKGKVSDVHD